MELRQLRYFVEVARELHFGRAAEKLFISQSALSQQIQLLEEEIGVDLFVRTLRLKQRKVELTEVGEQFLIDVVAILKQSEMALENARSLGQRKNELRVGFFKLAFREWIVEIIHTIARHFPEVEVKIIEYPTVESVQDGLLEQKIDLGMMLLPLKDEALASQVYKNDYLSVILSEHHPLATADHILLEELKDQKWVVINKPLHPFYDYIERLCQKAGFSRESHIVQEVSSHEMLCSLVSLDIGIAFMPSLFDLSKEPGLVARKVLRSGASPTEIEVNHAIAWRKRQLSPLVKAVVNTIG
ncbi:LysR family transcriptional regulator [Telluribacter sp. SYSU D00476]|uniref:LysR family transcriptional regulator n=1 Tax=Telluribacter sp. SYSU D00476 TaxID=2811430 RepID=UPI001FF40AAC|nr:LysR family transcriptional regulator [Telluribacter sp. SYSU D00476]